MLMRSFSIGTLVLGGRGEEEGDRGGTHAGPSAGLFACPAAKDRTIASPDMSARNMVIRMFGT